MTVSNHPTPGKETEQGKLCLLGSRRNRRHQAWGKDLRSACVLQPPTCSQGQLQAPKPRILSLWGRSCHHQPLIQLVTTPLSIYIYIYTCSCGASGCMYITHKNLCALSEICISAAWGLNFPQLSVTVNFLILSKGILPCHY